MELTQSPVFYLLLLSAAMGICVYLFISLKRAIFRLDRRGRTTEQFLSCILSDQLYWSKETPTNGQDGTTASWRWVKSVWPPAIAQALEEMLGAKVEFDWLPIEAVLPTACSEDTWWQTEFSGMGGALVYCGCVEQVAGQIGRAALSAVGGSKASEGDALETYREIVGQSLSAMARSLSRDRKIDIACTNGRECQRPADSGFVLPVKLIFSQEECGPIWIAVSPEFESLFAPPDNAALPAPIRSNSQPSKPKATGLLLDVELPVTVSFGSTVLPLTDVVELRKGSILELNRSIAEPVEVIVNNNVIARGEVVVIEGSFGVRIQEIISRRERMRTLC